MRISDWSSDVCSSDLETSYGRITGSYRVLDALYTLAFSHPRRAPFFAGELAQLFALAKEEPQLDILALKGSFAGAMGMGQFMPSSYRNWRSEEHTSELQSLMRISYAVFCLKKKKTDNHTTKHNHLNH